MKGKQVNKDRPPNFRDKEGKLFLVRYFACNSIRGRENYGHAVTSGQCAWCGWTKEKDAT
ncbi:hypothetical protein ACFL35_18930 [Candidatus Riflebacteria bacterium]